MDTPTLTGWSLALLALTILSIAGLLVALRTAARARREQAEQAEQVERARAGHALLEQRLEALTDRLAELEAVAPEGETAYVITDAGLPETPLLVPDRLVLGAAVGEPLVKAVALGHGVRRALSAESRHRIRFAVRQETRRSRKQRRREMRAAWLAAKRSDGQRPAETASAA